MRVSKLIAVIGLLISFTGHAAPLNDLYEVTLPCLSQAQSEREVLFKQGLQQVFEKISLEPESNRYPDVAKALDNALDYVEQYAYEGNMIRIRYSSASILPLMQKTGQKTWGQHRPNVMVWLAIEEGGNRRLIGQETDPTLFAKLQQMANERGVPLVLPLMDIEDINAVSAGDVWGQFPTVLQKASDRYGAKMTLVGRLQLLSTGSWKASWQWLTDNDPIQWETSAPSLETALNAAFDRMTTQLKDNYAAKTESRPSTEQGEQKSILIGIANVNCTEDFVRVENYLEGLEAVTQVVLKQVMGDRAIFEIIPEQHQSRERLAQTIGYDQQLMSLGQHDPHFQEVDLAYRWVALGSSRGQ